MMHDEWLEFGKNSEVNVGEVDCDLHWPICDKYGVDALPTLIWFPPGSSKSFKYLGPRSISNWMEFSAY
jgi:thioredoxin-like negative regulator of GroEL